ncbi:GNAT family N-acetyltransferase [Rapidithrix thailandica]|uniref:GNAT family N-acetyltransferase n=1 Tax=Rapidithrix thailandica TaxID=413964 RepID=A0AAW9RWH0_9BACT
MSKSDGIRHFFCYLWASLIFSKEMEERIILSKFNEHDFESYYRLVGNEQVMAMVTERAIPTTEAQEDFQKLIQTNHQYEAFGNFKVFSKATQTFLGLAKLELLSEERGEVELGYLLLPEHWGKGYGSEIAKLLVNRAKENQALKIIKAIIDPNNIASKKILLKQGFVSVFVGDMDGLPGEILELAK